MVTFGASRNTLTRESLLHDEGETAGECPDLAIRQTVRDAFVDSHSLSQRESRVTVLHIQNALDVHRPEQTRDLLAIFVCRSILQKPNVLQEFLRQERATL